MLISEKIKKAKNNFDDYLHQGLIKKTVFNQKIFDLFLKNSNESIELAEKLHKNDESKLWVIVISYYSMFYIANAVIYKKGYKIGDKIAHKITSDTLIVLFKEKLKKSLLEDFEELKDEALAVIKSEELLCYFEFERMKRGRVQYSMTDDILDSKAKTSLIRAKEFVFSFLKLCNT